MASAVRSLRFLPLTFVAGVHGFALFAPYLAIAIALTHLLWARRRRMTRRARPQSIRVRLPEVGGTPESLLHV